MKRRSLVFALVIAALLFPLSVRAQDPTALPITSADVEIVSGDQAYVSYLAAPNEGGPHPAVLLIHSFRGLEEGYRTMTDQFAAEGFVVLAVGWQTFEQNPADATMEQLLRDSVAFLTAREDVDAARIGLTGFCAGGRYTMRYLPILGDLFAAGVAWYGFPNDGSPSGMDLVGDVADPLLIIHGTKDDPSPIGDIYEYAEALDDAGAYFELKVYQGEPHGFMLQGGQLRTDEIAQDAYQEMVTFFQRKL